MKEGNTMKRCFTILSISILIYASLGFGFVEAVDHIESECALQEPESLLVDKVYLDDASEMGITQGRMSLDEISMDDISMIEAEDEQDNLSFMDKAKAAVEENLTVGDQLRLLLFHLKMKTTEHKYILGMVTGTIILGVATVWYLNKKNQNFGMHKN
jgi:hypothetical protein